MGYLPVGTSDQKLKEGSDKKIETEKFKDTKEVKDSKEASDSKEVKDSEKVKDTEEFKDTKDVKDIWFKDDKEFKDDKDIVSKESNQKSSEEATGKKEKFEEKEKKAFDEVDRKFQKGNKDSEMTEDKQPFDKAIEFDDSKEYYDDYEDYKTVKTIGDVKDKLEKDDKPQPPVVCSDDEYKKFKEELLKYHCEKFEEPDCESEVLESKFCTLVLNSHHSSKTHGHHLRRNWVEVSMIFFFRNSGQ